MIASVKIGMRGERDKIGYMSVNIPANSLDDVIRELDTFLFHLSQTTDGQVVSVSVSFDVMAWLGDYEYLATPAATGSDIEQRAVFTLTGERGAKLTLTIPTWKESLTQKIVSSRRRVPDYLNDSVYAFVNYLRWPGAGLSGIVDSRGERCYVIKKSDYKFKP